MLEFAQIIINLHKGPGEWQSTPRPKDGVVFVRSKDSAAFHLDETTHFINKLMFPEGYLWAHVREQSS